MFPDRYGNVAPMGRLGRIVTPLSLALIAVAALWFVGDRHRESCVRDGRVSCSLLPWDNGVYPRPSAQDPLSPEYEAVRHAVESGDTDVTMASCTARSYPSATWDCQLYDDVAGFQLDKGSVTASYAHGQWSFR